MSGYSGTPLVRKLGIAEGHRLVALDAPDALADWLGPLPEGVVVGSTLDGPADVVLVFATEREVLQSGLLAAAPLVFPGGAIWAAWPKRASKVPTDVTEDVVRAVALPRGLVDNKVCAISEVWSGLRLVWRRQYRGLEGPPHLLDEQD